MASQHLEDIPLLVGDFDSSNPTTSSDAIRDFTELFDNGMPQIPCTDLGESDSQKLLNILIDLNTIPKLITLAQRQSDPLNESTLIQTISATISATRAIPTGPRIAVDAGAIPLFIKLLDSTADTIPYHALSYITILLDDPDSTITTEIFPHKPIPQILRLFTAAIEAEQEPFLSFTSLIPIMCRLIKIEPYIPEITDIIDALCTFISRKGSDQSHRNHNTEIILEKFIHLCKVDNPHDPIPHHQEEIISFLSEHAIVPVLSLSTVSKLSLEFLVSLLKKFPFNRTVIKDITTTSLSLNRLFDDLAHTDEAIRYGCMDVIRHCTRIQNILKSQPTMFSTFLRQICTACFKPCGPGFDEVVIETFYNVIGTEVDALDFDSDADSAITSVPQLYMLMAKFVSSPDKIISTTSLTIIRFLISIKEWQKEKAKLIVEYKINVNANKPAANTTLTPSNQQKPAASIPLQPVSVLKPDLGSLLASSVEPLYSQMNKAITESPTKDIKLWESDIFYGVLRLLVVDLGFVPTCKGDILNLERPGNHEDCPSGRGPLKVTLKCTIPPSLP